MTVPEETGAAPCGVAPCGVAPCGVSPSDTAPCDTALCGVTPCGVSPSDAPPCDAAPCKAQGTAAEVESEVAGEAGLEGEPRSTSVSMPEGRVPESWRGPPSTLQTRTTVFASFRSSERLRAPMGPISGRVGSLGDGVPEGIAGDKKNSPRPLYRPNVKKPVFLLFLARRAE